MAKGLQTGAVAPPYAIRPATQADVDQLIGLLLELQDHLEAAHPEIWRMTPQARSQMRGKVVSRLSATRSRVLVAEHTEGTIVGCIFGRVVTNTRYTPTVSGLVDQAFVQPGHRRMGIGARLVAGLCGFFDEHGADDIGLRYVVGNQEAAAFWDALGFSPRIITAGAATGDVEASLGQGVDR